MASEKEIKVSAYLNGCLRITCLRINIWVATSHQYQSGSKEHILWIFHFINTKSLHEFNRTISSSESLAQKLTEEFKSLIWTKKKLFYLSKQKWTLGDILLIKELPFQYQHVPALLDIIISIDPLIREAWTRREVWTCMKDLKNGPWRGSNGILSLLLFKGNLHSTSPRPEISTVHN